jgi:hypothetical protein
MVTNAAQRLARASGFAPASIVRPMRNAGQGKISRIEME